MSDHSRLVLGTAQLGMQYGIANHTGRPDEDGAYKIVRTKWSNGIFEFDTVQACGKSKKSIGQIIKNLLAEEAHEEIILRSMLPDLSEK